MTKTSKNITMRRVRTIQTVGVEEARELMKKSGAVIIDVRETDEWRQGHIPKAIAHPARLFGTAHRGQGSRSQDPGDPAMRVGHALVAGGARAARDGLRPTSIT